METRFSNFNPQPLVALSAANALDHLVESARPVLQQIRAFVAEPANQDLLGWQFPVWLLEMALEKF